MTNIIKSVESNNITIKKFKVQGLDLIVTTPNGTVEKIENGLSEIISGGIVLLTEQGNVLSQDEILSSITMNIGADAIYLKEQFISETIELAEDIDTKKDEDDEEKQFAEKLAELNQENQKLAKEVQALESQTEKQEEQLSSSLTKLSEAKAQLKEQIKSEKSKKESVSDPALPPSPPPMPAKSSTSSESSTPANKTPENPIVIKPKTQVFIQGKLSEESDSGKKDDGITNNNKPTFIGTVSLDSQAYLILDGIKYPITADKEGHWSLKITKPLKDGVYEYELAASADGSSPLILKNKIIIDTQLESLSVGLEGNSDSGTPGDKLTKHNTPTFAGQTEANSIVTLQIAEQKLVTTADAQGRWRITVEKPLTDEQHDYTVTAVDVAGNTKAVAETVTIKTTLPNATAQLKDIQGFITNQNKPTFMGTTDPYSTVNVVVGQKDYPTKADKNGEWSVQLNELADNVYTYRVIVTDLAGNKNEFSDILQIDTQLPSTVATLTKGTDSGVQGDNMTNNKSPVLIGKTKPSVRVDIKFEGKEYSVFSDKDGTWNWNLPPDLKDNQYTYTVSVTDKAGNKAESKGTFIIDTEMTLTGGLDLSSQSNIVSSDVVTNLLRPQISGKSDPNSKITGEFKGTKKTVYCDEQGKWSLTFDVNAKIGKDNEYVITAKDAAGNEKILKQSFSYTPPPEGGSGESPPPTLSVELDKESDSGNKDDFTTNIKTPKFSGTATKGAEVKLYIDTQKYTANADAVTGAWEISVKSLPEGGNPYRVTAEHPGNRKIVEIKGSVTIDTMLPSTAATLTEGSDSGVQGDNITHHKSPALTGKTKPHAVVTISIENENGSYETTANANGEWTQTLPTKFTEGEHPYTVSVTDKAGNQAESDGAFFIDTKSYGKSLSFDKNVYNGYGWINHNTPIFVGEAEANSVVTMRFGGKRFSTVADKQGKWHLKIKYPFADNSYYCDFAFIDVAGNKTQTGEWVIIKTTLPSTDAKLKDINGFVTNQNKPTFMGTTDPYSTVNVVVGQKDYPTKADKNGEWSVQLNELADNVYTYRVIVTDLAGNKNEFSDILQIDTQLPSTVATLTKGSDSGVQGDNITKDQSPALTGKTKPHAAVTISIENENGSYETIANANGEWTQTLPTEFTEGEHTYTVSVTDKAGNKAESKGTFIIDTEMTLTGGLDLSSQSNIVSSDVVTNLLRPQISGKSDPNSKITGEFKGTKKTVYCDEQGKWSLTFDVNAKIGKDNEYVITAKDAAGNEKILKQSFSYTPPPEGGSGESPPPTLSVELDKESDSGNKDGYITNVKKPTFTGTATKSAKITFKITGQELTEIADATTGKWAITLDSLQDGGHHYTVTAEHPTNGKSTDESGVIFIDTTPPFTVVKLTDAIELGTSGDFITKKQKPEFTGKSVPGNKVTLKLNDKSVDTTCDENGAWLLALDETLDKNYSGKYKIIVTDAADNHFETTGTLQIDNTIPFLSAITLNSSATRDRNGVLSTNDLTPIFSGTTTPGSKLKFEFSYYTGDYFWERREFDVTDIDKNGQWSFTFPSNLMKAGPLYGVSSIGVVATSPAGNTNNKDFEKKGLWIKKGVYTIDSLIDAESSPTGKDDLKVSVSKTPKLHGTIKGGVTGDEFKGSIQIAGKEYPLTITGKTGKLAAWSFELPTQNALSQGQHGYTLKFQDVYGSTEKFHSFLVVSESNIFLDPETDSGHQGNGYINHNKPIYKGIAEPKAKISVKVGGKEYKTQANDKGEWQLEVPLDGDGEHNLIFRDETKDLILGIVKLNVLTTPPTFNEFHIEKSDTHSKAADVAKNNNPHLNFTYTGNMDYYEIAVNEKTIKYDKKSVNDDSSQTTFNNTLNLPNGEHKARITAFDIAGNKVAHETIIKVLSGEAQKPKIEFGITENQSISSDGGELTFDKNHLEITGKTSPAGIVKIKDKTGKEIGTTKADNEGTWAYTLPTECIPSDITGGGNLEFSITAYDLINRKSNINFSLIYDDSAPEITNFQTSEIGSNDTVYNNGLTFSGKTQPNSTVHFTLSKGQEAIHESAKADKTGNWQFKPLASQMPADGQYVYNITVENVLGKMSAEKDKLQGSLTIKTTPEITWGLDDNDDTGIKGDNITNIKTPKFSGKTEPHASIRLIFDNNLTHSYNAKADENGVWVIDEKVKFEEGSYGYTIAVEDKVHGISGQKHGRFQIDTTAPKVLTGGVIDARDGVAKEHVLTDANIPDFSGHSDPFARVLLNIKSPLDSTHFSQTIIADEKGSWAFTLPSASALKDGEYTYQARVEDSAGNLNNDLMLQGTIKVDTIAPDTLDGGVGNSKDNTYQLDCVTNITKPTFCGSAEPGVVLQLIVGEHVYKDIKVDEKGQWKFTLPSSLTEDTYIYKVEMKDAVGHKGTKSLRGKIIIDTTPPDVLEGGLDTTSDTGISNSGFTNHKTPTFSGTTESNAFVELKIANESYTGAADKNGQWTIPVTNPLPDGSYKYILEVKDSAGNKKSVVDNITIDTKAPELSGQLDETTDIGTKGNNLTNDNKPKFSGMTEAGAFVELKIANESYTGAADKNGQWTIPVTNPLPDGSYKYILEVKDSAGNKKSVVDNITIDTKAPELSGQLDETTDTGTKGDNLTNDNKPKFSGMTEAGAFVELTIDEKTYHVNADKKGQWTIPVTNPLTDGSYQYTLEVKDVAGNFSDKKITGKITIDSTLPDASIIPASTPVESNVVMLTDIPVVDNTISQIDIDNHNF
ncbi:Ig-like domain-containing protein [Providencia rettgeri]|uniref:Ig-like domain-containing protein n=1 Tax=Providencia rettgeri TaxID=587 RepID=UPI0032D9E3CC